MELNLGSANMVRFALLVRTSPYLLTQGLVPPIRATLNTPLVLFLVGAMKLLKQPF